MSLDRLLYELTVHYRSRGFPESALVHLRWTLVTNVRRKALFADGLLELREKYRGPSRSFPALLTSPR